MNRAIRVDHYGSTWIAHWDDCDCLADGAVHGTGEHPVSAMRKFVAQVDIRQTGG